MFKCVLVFFLAVFVVVFLCVHLALHKLGKVAGAGFALHNFNHLATDGTALCVNKGEVKI